MVVTPCDPRKNSIGEGKGAASTSATRAWVRERLDSTGGGTSTSPLTSLSRKDPASSSCSEPSERAAEVRAAGAGVPRSRGEAPAEAEVAVALGVVKASAGELIEEL